MEFGPSIAPYHPMFELINTLVSDLELYKLSQVCDLYPLLEASTVASPYPGLRPL